MGHFTDKVAIVTGAASGIGKAVAIELARNGAVVIAADIDSLGVAQTVEFVKRKGASAEAAHVDVARGRDVETLVENTVANRGHLDYIFNIAGVAVMGEVRDLSLDHWRRIVDVNMMGVVHGATAAYRVMLKQGSGHIVNMASLAGLVGYPTMSAYATTKAAVVAFSTNLRAEAEAFGIRVTALCPGFVDSGIYENAIIVNVAREHVRKLVPSKLMDTQNAAREIVDGVLRDQAVVVFPRSARLLWLLARHAPNTVAAFHRKTVRAFRVARIGP